MPRRIISRLIDRIRNLRERRGLTQEAFAEEAAISYKYYQAIEGGRKMDLRLSTLVRLAQAHDMEPWELLAPDASVLTVGDRRQARYGVEPRAEKKEKPGRGVAAKRTKPAKARPAGRR